MFISRRSRSSGVTILDLLVGIAILIILAGVAIVAGQQARMRAYNTQALVCGEQIRKAQTLYYSENHTFADAFSKLDAKMVARCALVSIVEVTATPQGYTYTVAHPQGNSKFTIEDDRASTTTLAGGAVNGAGATDTTGGGTVVGIPPTGTGIINVSVDWEGSRKWVQGGYAAPAVTVSGPSGTWTVTAAADPANDTVTTTRVLRNLAPGTYTVTRTGPVPGTSIMLQGAATESRAITNGTTWGVWSRAYLDQYQYALAIHAPDASNVASVTARVLKYVPDPMSTTVRCEGRCWDTAPAAWQVMRTVSVPLNRNFSGSVWRRSHYAWYTTTWNTYHPHLTVSDPVAIDAAQPVMQPAPTDVVLINTATSSGTLLFDTFSF